MIPAWLTCAEAWLVAMAKPGANVDACWARHLDAMNELWLLMLSDDTELQALANRGVW